MQLQANQHPISHSYSHGLQGRLKGGSGKVPLAQAFSVARELPPSLMCDGFAAEFAALVTRNELGVAIPLAVSLCLDRSQTPLLRAVAGEQAFLALICSGELELARVLDETLLRPLDSLCGGADRFAQAALRGAVLAVLRTLMASGKLNWVDLIAPIGDLGDLLSESAAADRAVDRVRSLEMHSNILRDQRILLELALALADASDALGHEAIQHSFASLRTAAVTRHPLSNLLNAFALRYVGENEAAVVQLQQTISAVSNTALVGCERICYLELTEVNLARGDYPRALAANLAAQRVASKISSGVLAAVSASLANNSARARVAAGRDVAESKCVRMARNYIAKNISKPLSVQDIASAIGVSKRTLEMRVREALQISVKDLLRKTRMRSAAPQIKFTNESVHLIAQNHGYHCVRTFGADCRREYGLTPAKLRRSTRSP